MPRTPILRSYDRTANQVNPPPLWYRLTRLSPGTEPRAWDFAAGAFAESPAQPFQPLPRGAGWLVYTAEVTIPDAVPLGVYRVDVAQSIGDPNEPGPALTIASRVESFEVDLSLLPSYPEIVCPGGGSGAPDRVRVIVEVPT